MALIWWWWWSSSSWRCHRHFCCYCFAALWHCSPLVRDTLQRKSSGLKLSKSQAGSDLTYSCHRNFELCVVPCICAFVAFLCLPSIRIIHAMYSFVREHIKAWYQYYSGTNNIGLGPGIGLFLSLSLCFVVCCILTNTQLNCAVTHLLFNYMFQKVICSPQARREMQMKQIFLLFFDNYFFFVCCHFDLEVARLNVT
jgi:hypothetical protein